jgi:hypothetical protein
MGRTNGVIVAVLLSMAAAGSVQGQPDFHRGFTSMQTYVSQWADPQAYYVAVDYQGATAPDIQTRINGRRLDIAVRQAARGPGGFMSGSSSRSLHLPPDADLSRMSQRQEQGRWLLVVPRRTGYPPRW